MTINYTTYLTETKKLKYHPEILKSDVEKGLAELYKIGLNYNKNNKNKKKTLHVVGHSQFMKSFYEKLKEKKNL